MVSAYFQTQWPLAFFIPPPTLTICTKSTPHTIPPYKKNHFLPSPIISPNLWALSLTPLNGSNSIENAYFQTQRPPGFFYFTPWPNHMYQFNSPHHPHIQKNPLSPLPLSPPISEPFPWPLWMAQIVSIMHISRPNVELVHIIAIIAVLRGKGQGLRDWGR